MRSNWHNAFAACDDQECSGSRRMWRRIWSRHSWIKLGGACYCAAECFERAATPCFERARFSRASAKPAHHRIPLGLLLLSRGRLTNSQLRTALEAQRTHGRGRIGEWLQSLGFATEQQIMVALGIQWGCPVLQSAAIAEPNCARMLPLRLLQDFRMLPIQFVASTRIFYLAFSDGLDYTALYAVEQMLHCRTEACLTNRSTLERGLERIAHEPRQGDLHFEGWREATEMAHITCDYVLKLGAEEVQVAACGEYIWVRLEAGSDFSNLLFRCPVSELEVPITSPKVSAASPPASQSNFFAHHPIEPLDPPYRGHNTSETPADLAEPDYFARQYFPEISEIHHVPSPKPR
jgi:Type II secretion system (T2SS), protein E, N-terminal domain